MKYGSSIVNFDYLAAQMKVKINITKQVLYFTHWCGKGYAIFAALGREVQIAGLALHICESALLKSAHKGIIINRAACREEDRQENIAEKIVLQNEIFNFQRGEMCPDHLENKIALS